jgi:hypothetical protein
VKESQIKSFDRLEGLGYMSEARGEIGDDSHAIHLLVDATLRGTEAQLSEFASQLCAVVRRDEPETTTYLWTAPQATPAATSDDRCYVEERYASEDAFIKHMDYLRQSGQIRELVKLLRVDQVLILEGNAELVNRELAPLAPVALRVIATI